MAGSGAEVLASANVTYSTSTMSVDVPKPGRGLSKNTVAANPVTALFAADG